MHPSPLQVTPTIDIGVLQSNSSSPEVYQQLDKLKVILGICGYLQVVNHGIEASILDELCDVSKRFFALPPEQKHKFTRPGAAGARFDAFLNDQILIDNQIVNQDDRLFLDLDPVGDQRTLKAWPDNPKDFRKILLEYSKKIQKLNGIILKAMAKSLKLEENCFLKQYGESPSLLARFNSHHPFPSSQQFFLENGADASALTFLIQDQVEALEVQIDNHRFRIPLTRHTILVKVGDQVEIMSNGNFKSRMHRLVTSADKEWIAVSVFCSPDNRNHIEPAEELIDENMPRLYKNVVDYTGTFFQEHRNRGQRLIDAIKF
ncbi:OLC1v1038088C1 [Oldenlandia corymbosa var. corymbosa]|uniref:OLC1v1038088C1 n=1 Tax=Oldenlandia corymbosa var. corymbosa TaxID=529605 RepID=A0AAV1D1L6_OLDCO|nr:OLC1v1038088C1 [Oldenlandia corymbosa var. corymbosa]